MKKSEIVFALLLFELANSDLSVIDGEKIDEFLVFLDVLGGSLDDILEISNLSLLT